LRALFPAHHSFTLNRLLNERSPAWRELGVGVNRLLVLAGGQRVRF
jgi:hypothetical protein